MKHMCSIMTFMKKVTLQTLDKKIGTLGQTLDKKIDTLGQTLDKKIDTLGQTLDKKIDTLVTIVDGLAVSTKKGFDEVKGEVREFKEDMTDFSKKTGLTLFALDSHARTTNERLGVIEKSLLPLEHLSQALKVEVQNLNLRVRKVELAK